MSVLSLLLNIAWIVCGGLWMALGWIIAAVIMVITIIGIPWAKAAFNISLYTLLPFGQKAVSRADYSGQEDIGTGPLGLLGNIIWLVLAGWWLALPRCYLRSPSSEFHLPGRISSSPASRFGRSAR